MRLTHILFLMVMTALGHAQDKTITLDPDLQLRISEDQIHVSGEVGKVVLLDFWASWCGPCRESFPWMNKMQAKYGDKGLTIIAINLDQSADEAQTFLQRYPADFQLAFDPNGLSAEAIGVAGMPTSFLLDQAGNVKERFIGFSPKRAEKHEQYMKEILTVQEKSAEAINQVKPIAMREE